MWPLGGVEAVCADHLGQVRVGMSVGHDPKSGPYRPDMRKDEKNITMEDRQEAKRRIEGSLAPDPQGYDVE